MKKTILVLTALVGLAGCQDHHFLPIEKAGHFKLPEDAAKNEKSFKEEQPAQKEVMSEAYVEKVPEKPRSFPGSGGQKKSQVTMAKNREATGGLIVSGRLELGPEQGKRDFKEFTVYIIAKYANRPGPPVAVSRYLRAAFPMEFQLDEENLMTPGFPSPDQKLVIEARLDRDGNAMSKEAGDVYGFTSAPITVGSKGISILLDKNR